MSIGRTQPVQIKIKNRIFARSDQGVFRRLRDVNIFSGDETLVPDALGAPQHLAGCASHLQNHGAGLRGKIHLLGKLDGVRTGRRAGHIKVLLRIQLHLGDADAGEPPVHFAGRRIEARQHALVKNIQEVARFHAGRIGFRGKIPRVTARDGVSQVGRPEFLVVLVEDLDGLPRHQYAQVFERVK